MPYENSSGKQCVVFDCKNNQKKLYQWRNSECSVHKMTHKDCPCLEPYKMHTIPRNDELRLQWIKSINRKDFKPSAKAMICSLHFVDGKPSKKNPVPTLHMGYTAVTPTPARRRPLVRKSLNLNSTTPPAKPPAWESCLKKDVNQENQSESELLIATPVNVTVEKQSQCEAVCCTLFQNFCQNKHTLVDACTQTIDVVAIDHAYGYTKRTRNVSCQQTSSDFGVENVTSDSESMFYTGLSLSIFVTLLTNLSQYGEALPYKVNVSDQIFAVLVRLRLGLTFQDLARRLNISRQLMSKIFQSWIDIMAKHLSKCVAWLPRDTIRRTLPASFRENYPRTTCIIDCSEIFIQRPFSLKARAQTWSTYKNSNTAKFLIAIAPNGFIMYLSPLYGGRASDNYITKDCGFLEYLLPGDEVMANRGFTISEDLCSRRVKLNIPAFMKGRSQLSEQEVIESRRIAANRIHVERAIMRLKSFRLINMKMSITSLNKANQVLNVIGALCNLRDSLIRDELEND